jgi:HPt (histidine-containing phosphotransfer) domain-containing protein
MSVFRSTTTASRIDTGLHADVDREGEPSASGEESAPPVSDFAVSRNLATVDEEVLDRLAAVVDHDPDAVSALVRDFIDSGDGRIREIRKAFEEGDRSGIRHGAHALRGCAGMFGAAFVSQRCRPVEYGYSTLTTDELGRAIEDVEDAWAITRRGLIQRCEQFVLAADAKVPHG